MIIERSKKLPPTLLLALILATAFLLRFYGVWFGLPFVLHDDEPNEVLRALQLGSGSFNYDRVGKGGYFFILFIEYGFLYFALKLNGAVQTASDFAKYFISDPTAFYLIGRTTTAAVGALNVYLAYRIGKFSYSLAIGLITALFLSVNLMHAELSHYITVDVPMVCLATASMLFALQMTESTSARNYYLAAIFAALATTTKMPAILLVIPLTIAHVISVSQLAVQQRKYFFNRNFWMAVFLFLCTYVILTPGIVVKFRDVMEFILSLLGLTGNASRQVLESSDLEAINAKSNLFLYYLNAVRESMGYPLFALSIGGVFWAIFKRKKFDIVLLSYILSTYFVASISTSSDLIYARYILPALPFVLILASRFLVDVVGLVMKQRAAALAAIFAIAFSIIPGYRVVLADLYMVKPDTRIIAKEWIDANIEANSKIFIEGATVRPYEQTVPLQYSRENILEAIEHFRDSNPGKAKYFELELEVLDEVTFDLVTVEPHMLESLQYYKDLGVDYFVLRPDIYLRSVKRMHWPKFVDEVRNDSSVTLLKRFEPLKSEVRGPLIEIYMVQNRPGPEDQN